MLLEPPVSVIETLKERIAVHGASLRENETRLAARAGAFSGWLRVRGVLAMDTSRTSFFPLAEYNTTRSTGLVWDTMPSEVSGTNQPQL